MNAERTVVISHDLWRTGFHSDPEHHRQDAGFVERLVVRFLLALAAAHDCRRHAARLQRDGQSLGLDAGPGCRFCVNAADAADLSRQIPRRRSRVLSGPSTMEACRSCRLRNDVTSAQAALRVAEFGERVRQQVHPNERDWSLQLYDARSVRFPFESARRHRARPSRGCPHVRVWRRPADRSREPCRRAACERCRTTQRAGAPPSRLARAAARLVRQLTAESLLLSVAGGAFGLLIARWLINLFVAGTPSRFVRWQISAIALEVPLDWRVMVFTTASCLVTGLFVGTRPGSSRPA